MYAYRERENPTEHTTVKVPHTCGGALDGILHTKAIFKHIRMSGDRGGEGGGGEGGARGTRGGRRCVHPSARGQLPRSRLHAKGDLDLGWQMRGGGAL